MAKKLSEPSRALPGVTWASQQVAVDVLRLQIVLVWSMSMALGYLLIVAKLLSTKARPYELQPLARDLLAVLGPTMLLLLASYFSGKHPRVSVTRGQRVVALMLTGAYLAAAIGITAAELYAPGVLLQQNGVDYFSTWLTPLQPVVVGPIFYIFGSAHRA